MSLSSEWFEELSESETPNVSNYLTLVAPIKIPSQLEPKVRHFPK